MRAEHSLFTALWLLGAFSEEETLLWPNGFLEREHNKHYAAIKQCGCCGLRTANFNFTYPFLSSLPPSLPLSALFLHPIPAGGKQTFMMAKQKKKCDIVGCRNDNSKQKSQGCYHHAAHFCWVQHIQMDEVSPLPSRRSTKREN